MSLLHSSGSSERSAHQGEERSRGEGETWLRQRRAPKAQQQQRQQASCLKRRARMCRSCFWQQTFARRGLFTEHPGSWGSSYGLLCPDIRGCWESETISLDLRCHHGPRCRLILSFIIVGFYSQRSLMMFQEVRMCFNETYGNFQGLSTVVTFGTFPLNLTPSEQCSDRYCVVW